MVHGMSDEQWRPVSGYEGWYDVSDLGRVRRVAAGGHGAVPGRVLRPLDNGRGYQTVMLSRHGTTRRFHIHRLVMAAFVGPVPTDRREVNHLDGDKANNRPVNLEYVNHYENMAHAADVLGRQFGGRGIDHPGAKLTEATVRDIRARCAAGETSRTIAAAHGVCRHTVSKVWRRHVWAHVV